MGTVWEELSVALLLHNGNSMGRTVSGLIPTIVSFLMFFDRAS